MNIDQKRIVLACISSRMGRAILEELSGRPVELVIASRDETRCRYAVGSAGVSQARVMSFACDLAWQELAGNNDDPLAQHPVPGWANPCLGRSVLGLHHLNAEARQAVRRQAQTFLDGLDYLDRS